MVSSVGFSDAETGEPRVDSSIRSSSGCFFFDEEPAAEVVDETAAEEDISSVQELAAEEDTVIEESADSSNVDNQTDTELQNEPPSDVEHSGSTIVENFEKKQLNNSVPSFRPGDTLVVSVKVKDGQRTRLQNFEGVVMSI